MMELFWFYLNYLWEMMKKLLGRFNITDLGVMTMMRTMIPGDVIESILERLPVKDAVRASNVSRHWRYRWLGMSRLEILDGGSITECNELWNAIDSILKQRQQQEEGGPIPMTTMIYSFKVITRFVSHSKLDKLLAILGRNPIKELVLDLHEENNKLYNVHWILFYCQGITVLELKGCSLTLPPEFKGFVNLLQLHLESSHISQDDLQSLISTSPLLKILKLTDLRGFDRLRINSSRLEYLYVGGEFTDLSLATTPLLATMILNVTARGSWPPPHPPIPNVSKILACANSVQKLVLFQYGAEFLAKGSKLEKLPVFFQRLKFLYLDLNFMSMKDISFLLSLLRSSPHLQELWVQGFQYKNLLIAQETVWRPDEDIDAFNNLRSVKLMNLEYIKPEMEFTKFVLGHSPVLEKMEIAGISPKSNTSTEHVLIQLLLFERASAKAEIVYIS